MDKIKKFKNKEELLANLEYNLICDFIKVRKDINYSQQKMADKANTLRESIAKIENQVVSPQINTLIKILEPFGYTLKIEKIDDKEKILVKDAIIRLYNNGVSKNIISKSFDISKEEVENYLNNNGIKTE